MTRISAVDDADLRHEFDAEFYLEQNPHVRRSSVDPVVHYLETGWREGADPAPWFSSEAYLTTYEDVRDAGVNPFAHYVRHGRREGRTAGIRRGMPAGPGDAAGGADTASPDPAERIAEAIAPHFDGEFYLTRNPDVAAAGTDPVRHYVAEGWCEGRDPTPGFSTHYYLESNPDVRESGLNPFWHYVVAGRAENRLPAEPGGYKAQILKRLPSFAETVEDWRACPSASRPIACRALATALASAMRASRGRLLVSLTHDNYREIAGGVQLCAQREEAAALAAGHCYVSLHPAQPLPCLSPADDAGGPAVNILLNGASLGTATLAKVSAALSSTRPAGMAASLVVHSLLGHAPEGVAKLARALDVADAWFWLHDNFSICPSYALQRNGITYCGAPPPASQACRICVYGDERGRHLPRIRALFEAVDFTVVAPSRGQLALWLARSGLAPARSVVLPHLSLDWSVADGPDRTGSGPVRVAFAGLASPIKGWPAFQWLAERCPASGGYSFHYFGIDEPGCPAVTAKRVSVSGGRSTAMRDALMAAEIDLLVHWSSCPETFSFSAYEALAAGAAIITHPGTGNVAGLVREHGRGALLADEKALLAFFLSGEARALAEANRRVAKRGARLAFSRMSVDLIEGEPADGDPLLHELHV